MMKLRTSNPLFARLASITRNATARARVEPKLLALGAPPWGPALAEDARFVLPTCDLAARALLTTLLDDAGAG